MCSAELDCTLPKDRLKGLPMVMSSITLSLRVSATLKYVGRTGKYGQTKGEELISQRLSAGPLRGNSVRVSTTLGITSPR